MSIGSRIYREGDGDGRIGVPRDTNKRCHYVITIRVLAKSETLERMAGSERVYSARCDNGQS